MEIHLIIDDFGTLTRLSDGTLQAIKDAGIEVEIFNPVHRYINRLYFNYRDHRKITVIDGYVAYAGGTTSETSTPTGSSASATGRTAPFA